MTRFLPLTRGGWPAEVLCEVTVGAAPLCVRHRLLNGDVSVEMHMLDGRFFSDRESAYDLIPAPEPSKAAVEAAVEALRILRAEPTCEPEDALKAGLRAAYAIDGITPQQQSDRVAELEAEVVKLRAAAQFGLDMAMANDLPRTAEKIRVALQGICQPGTGDQA